MIIPIEFKRFGGNVTIDAIEVVAIYSNAETETVVVVGSAHLAVDGVYDRVKAQIDAAIADYWAADDKPDQDAPHTIPGVDGPLETKDGPV